MDAGERIALAGFILFIVYYVVISVMQESTGHEVNTAAARAYLDGGWR